MITCPYCSRVFKGSKLNARHLSKCNPESSRKPKPCLCGHDATSLTQMKRHRKDCKVWQGRDKKALASQRRKETSLARYGVEDASQVPEVRARRSATNKARYGAENPFSKASSVYEKVQASLEGKRRGLQGEENPFSWPAVQEKIKATMLERHGAVSPQQVPEIRARTRTTCEERYGGQFLASSEIRAKAEATNLKRYGAAFAGGTPEVQAKVIKTNLARYGVPHTCMDPEVRRRQLETMEANYGSHYFASDEGKAAIREALLERYGVEHASQIEGFWEKAVATFQERYGVDHPLQLEEFREKQRATNIKRYGTPFPGFRHEGMNHLEARLLSLAPSQGSLRFTGDGQWWRWLPKLGHHKNPDFIVPGPDPKHPKRGVTRCVEAFGNYWHSRIFTGKAPFEHESELIAAFADIGIECLVIWESEVKGDPEAVRERLAVFLGALTTEQ